MKVQGRAGLTGDAWVRLIGELRQLIEDSFDPSLTGWLPWLEWVVNDSEVPLDEDDADFLRRELQRRNARSAAWLDTRVYFEGAGWYGYLERVSAPPVRKWIEVIRVVTQANQDRYDLAKQDAYRQGLGTVTWLNAASDW